MDAVFGWVRGIAVVVLMMTFIEMVLPRSDLKKYVDVIVGLAVIGAVLTPLLGLGVGIGVGLELAVATGRGWSASEHLSRPPAASQASTGGSGSCRELASSMASRALEARVRKSLCSSYGSRAEAWAVRVALTDNGQLASVEVEMSSPATASVPASALTEGASLIDRDGVARTAALALEAPPEVVMVK